MIINPYIYPKNKLKRAMKKQEENLHQEIFSVK